MKGDILVSDTRVFKVTGGKRFLDILEVVMQQINYLCSVGSSRSIYLAIDGDGSANLKFYDEEGNRIKTDYKDSNIVFDQDGNIRVYIG